MEKKPRNIVKVIEAIKKETTNEPLTHELDELIYTAGFRAPEAMSQTWRELVYLLDKAHHGFSEQERKKIGAIIRDEIDVGARE
jgi:hypothetical protein